MVHKFRSILALLTLAALLTLTGLAALQNYFTNRQQVDAAGTDGVTLWANRMVRPLRDVPPTEQILGYVSERDFPGLGYSTTDADEEFAMTQFVVAPRIVEEPGLDCRYVLVNLPYLSTSQVQALMSARGYDRLINEYGFGIFLFRKGSQ